MSTDTAAGQPAQVPGWAVPVEDNDDSHSPKSNVFKDTAFILEALDRQQLSMYATTDGAMIPTEGPATEPDGPRTYTYIAAPNSVAFTISPPTSTDQQIPNGPPASNETSQPPPSLDSNEPARSPHSPDSSTSQGGVGANHYPSSSGVPRLPPILQVEKQQVTTSATQVASANRRRNEAHFQCPVPGCGSTFTRRFNLRGHLRSHTEERPYVCQWPGCKKGFARQHDCKRHQALHTAKAQSNVCQGCKKTFSRLDALNRHLRSDGGSECRRIHEANSLEKKQGGTNVSSDTDIPVVPPEGLAITAS